MNNKLVLELTEIEAIVLAQSLRTSMPSDASHEMIILMLHNRIVKLLEKHE